MAINLQEIFDYVIPQPSYTGRLEKLGLLNAGDLKRAKNQSIAQGLLGAGLTYLATPKNQNYGSAAPYIAQAALGGLNAARKPVENLTEQALMNQKLNALEKTQTDETMTDKAFAELIFSTPELQGQGYESLPASQKAELLKQYTGAKFKNMFDPKEIKPKTDRTLEVLNDAGTPNDPSDDFLEKVVSEFDPKATNDDGTTGAWTEINRSPKELAEDHVEFTQEALELAAHGFILDGKLPPMGRGKSATTDRRKIINLASKIVQDSGGNVQDARKNAILNIQEFKAQEIALKNFSTGVEGRKVRSLNTAMDHLESMKEWSIALNNTDVRKVNAVKQQLAKEFGNPNVTNFDFAKQIVADEVLVSVVQAGGAMQERQELAEAFERANTPDQLLGVIETAHTLMAGQLQSLDLQYLSSVGEDLAKRKPFTDKLSPATKELYKKLKIGGNRSQEQKGLSLQNPNPADKEFIDMYLKDPNSETGKAIAKGLIQRGYTL